MSTPQTDLQSIITAVLQKRAGSSVAENVRSAAREAREDLAGVMVPIIGEVGLNALTARAMHVAQGELAAGSSPVAGNAATADVLEEWLKQYEPSRELEAASAMLSTLAALLGTFIGAPLTLRLLRKAWPDAFSDSESEETRS